MPIKTTCPDCDRPYTLADTMEGKTVKCKECGNSFTVQPTEAISAKPTNGKTKTGLSGTTKTIKGARRRNEDDEEKTPKKGSMGMWLLIGGGAAAAVLLLACSGIGLTAYLLLRGEKDTTSELATNPPPAPVEEVKPNPLPQPVQPPAPMPEPMPQPVPTPQPVPMPPPMPTTPPSKVTKDNFDKIMAKWNQARVVNLLGVPTDPDATVDPTLAATLGNKQKQAQKWQSGADSITVTYANNKAVSWVGVFDGETYTQSDPNPDGSGTKPNPNANTKVTKANYDMITVGMPGGKVTEILGTATIVSPQTMTRAAKNQPAQTRFHAQWTDGQGGQITVHFLNGAVERKTESGLK